MSRTAEMQAAINRVAFERSKRAYRDEKQTLSSWAEQRLQVGHTEDALMTELRLMYAEAVFRDTEIHSERWTKGFRKTKGGKTNSLGRTRARESRASFSKGTL